MFAEEAESLGELLPQYFDSMPQAAKNLASASSNPGIWDKIGNWWRGYLPKQESIREVARFNSQVDSVLDALEMSPEEMQKTLGERFVPLQNNLVTQMSQLRRSLTKLESPVEQLTAQISAMDVARARLNKALLAAQKSLDAVPPPPPPPPAGKEIHPDIRKQIYDDIKLRQSLESDVNKIGQEIEKNLSDKKLAEASLGKATEKANYVASLVDHLDTAEKKISTNLPEGIRYIKGLEEEFNKSGHSVFTELQHLQGWYQKIRQQLKEVSAEIMSHKLKSQNLDINKFGGWKKFLKEYARIKGLGQNVQDAWKANPDNAKTLNELLSHDNPKIRGLAQAIDKGMEKAGKIEIAKWVGKSPRDVARGLGLPSGSVKPAEQKGIKVTSWISGEVSKNIAGKLKKLSKRLALVGVNEQYATQAKDIQKAINSMAAIWKKIDADLPKQPDIVVKDYLSRMGIYMQQIAEADWKSLITNCKNKDEAKKIHDELISLLKENVTKFNAAMRTEAKADDQYADDDNLMKIQKLISGKDPSIKISGVLDAPTIRILQQLEGAMNAKTKDTEFTGKLVNPGSSSVIGYNDLMEILKRIKKY